MSILRLPQVIAADGEQKAARALKQASETISESSSAMQLRYLQASNKLSLDTRVTQFWHEFFLWKLILRLIHGFSK